MKAGLRASFTDSQKQSPKYAVSIAPREETGEVFRGPGSVRFSGRNISGVSRASDTVLRIRSIFGTVSSRPQFGVQKHMAGLYICREGTGQNLRKDRLWVAKGEGDS